MTLLTPSTVTLPEASPKVQEFLTYTDHDVKYMLGKLRQNTRWKRSDPDGHAARVEELKAQLKKSVMMTGPDGRPFTYSGLWHELRREFGWELAKGLDIPTAANQIPWAHVPEFQDRYYQVEAPDALFANAKYGPCAIELPTGAGKSRIIENICKRNPVQTTIVTPSKNITNQLWKEMSHLFGPKYVGKYGDGRHDLGKLFTVCTGQALGHVAQDTDAWRFFGNTKQLLWDESHTTPASMFEVVAIGLLGNCPIRFFISATQMRNDGTDIILKGITGPVVYRKDFKELVNEGFLARPTFYMFKVPAYGYAGSRDAKTEISSQLHKNPNVNSIAAEFAQKAVRLSNRQTLILVEEFSQFLELRKYINTPYEFAHGGVPDREMFEGTQLKDLFPREQWKPDVEAIVDRFNAGQTKLLIGTSAISTGVDTRPVGALCYLQGGTSEVKVKQGIGRGTRVTEFKKDVAIMDVKVVGSPMMERHADVRADIYRSMGEFMEIKT